jgi:hypothetical protein
VENKIQELNGKLSRINGEECNSDNEYFIFGYGLQVESEHQMDNMTSA